eukprot:CAMPEP_0114624146 /NCGR_PEP_ID=MMETSP0168-20121206/10621_1 /TAXON_ID=95228 ORGANISM="Vannella sp., Strain DIVA3 517/6/12" /NCGR_SAMPLE_ID=MMETSP0168 /ASSEMBLY_ACC=CAM_ASM_000044 /LENGTH=795 /DNA_ID=CAMNT_0001835421 /DNA_START=21 /DNA_END=2405 /DNA_ORIENTATION=+
MSTLDEAIAVVKEKKADAPLDARRALVYALRPATGEDAAVAVPFLIRRVGCFTDPALEEELFEGVLEACEAEDSSVRKKGIRLLGAVCSEHKGLYVDSFFTLLELLAVKEIEEYKIVANILTKQIFVNAVSFVKVLFAFVQDSPPDSRSRALEYFTSPKTVSVLQDVRNYPGGDEMEKLICQYSTEATHYVTSMEWLWIVEMICTLQAWRSRRDAALLVWNVVGDFYKKIHCPFDPRSEDDLHKLLNTLSLVAEHGIPEKMLGFCSRFVVTRAHLVPEPYLTVLLRMLTYCFDRASHRHALIRAGKAYYELLLKLLPHEGTKISEVNWTALEATLVTLYTLARALDKNDSPTLFGDRQTPWMAPVVRERLALTMKMTTPILRDTENLLRHLGIDALDSHRDVEAAREPLRVINAVKNVRSAGKPLMGNQSLNRPALKSWCNVSSSMFVGRFPSVADRLRKYGTGPVRLETPTASSTATAETDTKPQPYSAFETSSEDEDELYDYRPPSDYGSPYSSVERQAAPRSLKKDLHTEKGAASPGVHPVDLTDPSASVGAQQEELRDQKPERAQQEEQVELEREGQEEEEDEQRERETQEKRERACEERERDREKDMEGQEDPASKEALENEKECSPSRQEEEQEQEAAARPSRRRVREREEDDIEPFPPTKKVARESRAERSPASGRPRRARAAQQPHARPQEDTPMAEATPPPTDFPFKRILPPAGAEQQALAKPPARSLPQKRTRSSERQAGNQQQSQGQGQGQGQTKRQKTSGGANNKGKGRRNNNNKDTDTLGRR